MGERLYESTACDQAVEPSRRSTRADFLESAFHLVGDEAITRVHDANGARHVSTAGIMKVNAQRVHVPFRIPEGAILNGPVRGESFTD